MSEFDQERVPCEECGQHDAVCTVAVMMGKQVLHRKLCQACMAKASMSIASGNIGQVLGALVAAAKNAAQAATRQAEENASAADAAPEAAPGVACPQCGRTLAAFRKDGRLGCAACCTALREELLAQLTKTCPEARHTGRSPVEGEQAQRSRARLEALQRQMAEAVAREDYETAARCRDAMRSAGVQEDSVHE